MNSARWRNLSRNAPVPKRSVIYCVAAALTTFTAIFQSLALNLDSYIVLPVAGLSFFFWFAAALVWRKEQRNEAKPLDKFLRDPLVSEKYVFHYFVAVSLILTFNAILVFYVVWSFGLIATFPTIVFGYLAYVSWCKKKSTVKLDG